VIRVSSIEGSTNVHVVFTVARERVGDAGVSVVGDFNGWDPRPHPLHPCADGTELVTRITLKAGERYAFRYLTGDGLWFNDDAAHGDENNGIGAQNSILDLNVFSAGAPGHRENSEPEPEPEQRDAEQPADDTPTPAPAPSGVDAAPHEGGAPRGDARARNRT
jgi:hypothetical protein